MNDQLQEEMEVCMVKAALAWNKCYYQCNLGGFIVRDYFKLTGSNKTKINLCLKQCTGNEYDMGLGDTVKKLL